MKLIAQKYNFTQDDVAEIKLLGYDILNHGTVSLVEIMQNEFRNFSLLSLLKIVEVSFSPTTIAKIHREIEFHDFPAILKIHYYNEFADEDDALLFVREFLVINNAIEIKHDYCVLPKTFRGKGFIKSVFKESLQQYVNMNAKKITVNAGLSGGGYTWAKHGFVATKKQDVDWILNKAKGVLLKNDYEIVKKIYEKYYNIYPKGTAFPMDLWAALDYMKVVLMGSEWQGALDLKNKDQFRNFK